MSNALLQSELGWFKKKKCKLELREERRSAEEGSKLVKNKGCGSFQENTKRFALGFLVQRTTTSPNRKPVAPESGPI